MTFCRLEGKLRPKRALEIAAAGGHNILMVGSPGSGKTMLSQALPTILPPLTFAESLSISKIYSIAGLLPPNQPLILQRPFRSPHHSASTASIIGGGRIPHPGEVSLSHHGVLFLDEFPEYRREVLEALRQPLEDQEVTVSRVHRSHFPVRCYELSLSMTRILHRDNCRNTAAKFRAIVEFAVGSCSCYLSGPTPHHRRKLRYHPTKGYRCPRATAKRFAQSGTIQKRCDDGSRNSAILPIG